MAEIFTGTPGAFVDLETTHLGFFKDDYLWSGHFCGIILKSSWRNVSIGQELGSFGFENEIRMGLDGLVYQFTQGWLAPDMGQGLNGGEL